uniref:Uncharacterized protein n=1 Tax=Anguilla anguilla TaxID=7936 RepID=A0A0E9TY74_ANGAN
MCSVCYRCQVLLRIIYSCGEQFYCIELLFHDG